MPFEIITSGEDYAYASVDNVLITYYLAPPRIEAMKLRDLWAESLRQQGRQGGVLVFVDRSAQGSPPSAEVRRLSTEQAQKFAGTVVFSSVVIEGDGVPQMLVRTSLRGLAILVGRPLKVKFSATLAQGATWAATQAAPGPSARELMDCVRALRERF